MPKYKTPPPEPPPEPQTPSRNTIATHFLRPIVAFEPPTIQIEPVTNNFNLPSLTPRTLLFSILILLMASAMPTFISRLFRPFSTSTRLGLNPEGASSINTPEGAAKATVAAGCFWGVEHMYRKEFKGKGLYDARVGYIGGDTQSPSYRAVCSGRTGRTFPHFPFSRSGRAWQIGG